MLIAAFAPYVALELPGCDDFIIQRVVREELANLYRQYNLWQYTAAATIATTGAITFSSLPTDSEVIEIRSLRAADRMIEPMGVGSMNDADFDSVGDPLVCFQENDSWVVQPRPPAALTGTAVLQLGVSLAADEVPDTLAAKHRTMWEHLVLTRLQGMAGQAWTNPKAAAYHASEATRHIFEERRRMDGWTSRRVPVVRYGGL